jgi:hypothetical protein
VDSKTRIAVQNRVCDIFNYWKNHTNTEFLSGIEIKEENGRKTLDEEKFKTLSLGKLPKVGTESVFDLRKVEHKDVNMKGATLSLSAVREVLTSQEEPQEEEVVPVEEIPTTKRQSLPEDLKNDIHKFQAESAKKFFQNKSTSRGLFTLKVSNS